MRVTADEGICEHKYIKDCHGRGRGRGEIVQYCSAMLLWPSFILLKSQDYLLVNSIPAYKGKYSNNVKLTFMILPPPLAAASANVAAEKKVKRASTLIIVIIFMIFNSDCFSLLNEISKKDF